MTDLERIRAANAAQETLALQQRTAKELRRLTGVSFPHDDRGSVWLDGIRFYTEVGECGVCLYAVGIPSTFWPMKFADTFVSDYVSLVALLEKHGKKEN